MSQRTSNPRCEFRQMELQGQTFVVVFNFVPLDTGLGKAFDYWMADFMWPELERCVRENCASLARKTQWSSSKVDVLKLTATTKHLATKIKFRKDYDDCLKIALDIPFNERAAVAKLTIYVEVTYIGDKIRLRKALQQLQTYKDYDVETRPKTPTSKRPLSQLQNRTMENSPASPQKVDLTYKCEPSTSSEVEPAPRKEKAEAKPKKEKSEKSKGEDREEGKKKSSKEVKKKVKPDKSQTTINNYFGTPPSGTTINNFYSTNAEKKSKKDGTIANECSPMKRVKLNYADSPSWDSPMPVSLKPSTSQEKFESFEFDEEQDSIEVYRAASRLRSPVKQNTPVRKHAKEEDSEIAKMFPDSDDWEFKKDCSKLKSAFKSGEIDKIRPEVVVRMFQAFLPYMKAVHSGEIPSLLRDEFFRATKNNQETQFADGGILFSFKNLNLLISSINKEMFSTALEENKNMNYTMKVLIPEFISRLVMSIYKMTKEEALQKIKRISIYLSEMHFSV